MQHEENWIIYLIMGVKEIAIKTIQELPDDVDWETVRERIAFVSALRKGLDELDRGEGVPVEKVEEELEGWLRK